MKVAEFFAKIGFQIDDKALEEVDKKMVAARNQTLKLAAALTAAVYAMDRFAAASVRSAVALTNFNVQTGLSTDKLQKWQAAAQLENMAIDADSVANSIQALQQNLTQIRLGQGNASPFQLLGIDIQGRDAFDILEQVREKIQGLDPALAANMTGQMGIDPNMLNALRLTRKEFDALGNSLSRSKGTTDALVRIGSQINRLKLGFGKFKDDLVAKLEPAFMAITSIIERLGKSITSILELFERFPSIGIGVAGAFAAILVPIRALAILLSPITLAFAALFLILEDIAVYFEGGNSITGMLVDNLGELAGKLQSAFKPIADILEGVSELAGKNIIEPIQNFIGDGESSDNSEFRPLLAGESFKSKLDSYLLNMGADKDSMFGGLMRLGGTSTDAFQSEIDKRSGYVKEGNTFYNNFEINSDRPYAVAKEVFLQLDMQDQMDFGLTDMNNGVEY